MKVRRFCRFSAGSRGGQRARKRKQRTSKSCAALPGHARSFANSELEATNLCEPAPAPVISSLMVAAHRCLVDVSCFKCFTGRASVRATIGVIKYRRIPMALGETHET